MKIRKLTFLLNAIHLTHLIVSMCIILIVNFFILRGVIYERINTLLKANNAEFAESVSRDLLAVEQASMLAVEQITHENLFLPDNDLIRSLKLNPIIDSIKLISFNNEEFKLINKSKWEVGLDRDSLLFGRFIVQIDFEHQLVIELTRQWLSKIVKDHYIPAPEKVLIFNREFCVALTDSALNEFKNTNINLDELRPFIDHQDNKGEGFFVNRVHFDGIKTAYYAHLTYNSKLGVFLAVIHPRSYFFSYLGRYPAYLIMFFVIVLIVIANATVRTNSKFARPYSEIVQYLQTSKYVRLNFKSNMNESMLIKRSIDLLHNRLDFYVKNFEKAAIESKKIDNDLKIARRLQKNILAKDMPELTRRDDFDIFAVSEAAYDIGGDLYDYFLLDESHLLFVVGDISGKGIPAALFMIYTQTLLRSIAKPGMKVTDIVGQLNNKLIEENISDLFVTLFIGILDTATGKLAYCNAAHNLPLFIRNEGIVEEFGETHGIPLGIYPDRNYSSSEVQLDNGDQFLVYTDGVIDTIDENGMNYSVDVLKYNLMGSWFLVPKEVVAKIKQSVVDFRGNIDPVDDLTILAFKFNHKVNK